MFGTAIAVRLSNTGPLFVDGDAVGTDAERSTSFSGVTATTQAETGLKWVDEGGVW